MESQNIEYKQSWKDEYRNSVVAEMMKTLNYVNMFNHGISEVQELLKENNSPEAEFNVNYVTAFSVVIRDEDVVYNTSTVHQLFTNLSTQDKSLIINLKEQQLSTSELQLFTNCSPQSKQLFIKQVITRTHPNRGIPTLPMYFSRQDMSKAGEEATKT